MADQEDVLEVRTFAIPEEIWNLDDYQSDNGVNSDNYDRIIGDYWFPDEVKCCFLKPNGKLCYEDHKWGFVARLVDGSVTIVGNSCAIDKFGADSTMKADRSRYLNEKRRREAFAHLTDLLASKAEIVSKLNETVSHVKALKDQVDDFTSKLGQGTSRRLEGMYRTGNTAVTVQGVSYREYIDEDGEKRIERTVTQHTIGHLRGLNCLSNALFLGIGREAQVAESAFDEASQLQDSAKINQIKSVITGLKAPDRARELVEALERDVSELLNNDALLLCFLTSDKTDRYKLAQLGLVQRKQDVGRDKAKSWLAEQEAQLASSLGVDKVESP